MTDTDGTVPEEPDPEITLSWIRDYPGLVAYAPLPPSGHYPGQPAVGRDRDPPASAPKTLARLHADRTDYSATATGPGSFAASTAGPVSATSSALTRCASCWNSPHPAV